MQGGFPGRPAAFLASGNLLASSDFSIYEAKTHLSKLIEAVERGEEVIVARRNKPVAKIVPASAHRGTRIGGLAGRPFKLGKGFDSTARSEALGDLFGVARK